MKLAKLSVLALCALPLLTGCSNAKRAFGIASARSGCDAKEIKVVSDTSGDAVLDVCGVYEDWHYHAFNGWEYKGPAAQQPLQEPLDADGDGIQDSADACLAAPGVPSLDPLKNGCPPPLDSDADGIADNADACPNQVGIANADPTKNGCPSDRDGDTIIDEVDACPDVAGVANAEAAKNGCLPDKDGDGIPDALDGCPDEAGVQSADKNANGCPVPPDADGDGIPDAVDACGDQAGVANADAPEKNGCPEGVTGKVPEPPAPEAPPAPGDSDLPETSTEEPAPEAPTP